MEGAKVTAGVRKVKKKPVKDELDRMKQAEKKKRRLEKALATSAAIRSELEKKKQKKKEEQDRLDEEGAAIAEAVALHVLLGEDSDDSMLMKDEGPASWGRAIPPPVPYRDLSKNNGYMCNHWGNSNLMGSSDFRGMDFLCPRYVGEDGRGNIGISAGHIAAQAVSSLRIGDDARVEAYMFNRMLRG